MSNQPIFSYLFWGITTTILNFFIYYIFTTQLAFSIIPSTIIAWIITIIAAFLTNKQWVFKSCCWQRSIFAKEFISFIGCRFFTGLLELAIMYIFAELLRINDIAVKICANAIVIITNYLASRLFIFAQHNT